MFTPHRETDRTTQTRPDQQLHRPTCERGDLPQLIHPLQAALKTMISSGSVTSIGSSDGGTVWCCSLHQWVRVLNTSISVQPFVAFCVSSFVVLCVADLQVFIIVSHPESKCVSQRTSALTPRRLNKTRL